MKIILSAAVLITFMATAWGHGHYAWIMKHQNAKTGEWCCGPTDCFKVPTPSVNGAEYVVQTRFGAKRFPAAQTKLSEDNDAWACHRMSRPGKSIRCLFLPFSG